MKESFTSNSLKSEKFTFIVLICIMLFSLIYMSSYSLLMQTKLDHFQEGIVAIHKEMAILQEFLPEKDSLINLQKQKIIEQMIDVQREIAKSQTSEEERKRLSGKLEDLRNQIMVLKMVAKEKIYTMPVVVQQPLYQAQKPVIKLTNDTVILAKDKEIAKLKAVIAELKAIKPSVILKDKLAMYYFTVVSSDKKSRANRTKTINMQFQLKGNMDSLKDKFLYIEIRDPSHKVISTPKDKLRISNHFVSEYIFEPANYAFSKGKYSIKIYSQEVEFQTVTFLKLI